MGDINPQIDLVHVCFLQGRVYNPLKNRKFHEVSAGIPCVAWEKPRYGKVSIVLAWAKAMQELASGEIERTSQVVLLVLARRHDLFLASFGHPGRPDLGQQVNIEFISKDHHLMVLQGFGLIPDTSQTLEPFGIVIFSYQLGPFPHPAHLVEPASHGFDRYPNTVFGFESRTECGTTPARAAPAIGPWGGFEQGAQETLEPGHQDGRVNGHAEPTVRLDSHTQGPFAISTDDAVDAGARAEQEGGNLSWVAPNSAQQEHMQCQEIAIAPPTERREHPDLLLLGHVQ